MRALVPVVAAVALAVGAAELIVRFAVPQGAVLAAPGQRAGHFSPDDVLSYRLDARSHWVHTGDRNEFVVDYWTTAEGFRGSAPGAPACAGREVLCLGNSFVEGWGVPFERSFLKLSEAALAATGRPLCLTNYGMSGYSSCQSYLLAKQLLREKARPVVYFFAPGTPFDDQEFLRGANLDANKLATGVDAMKLGSPRPGAGPPRLLALAESARPTLESSALFRMLLRALRNRYEVDRIVPGDPATDRFFFTREKVDWRAPLEDTMRHLVALHEQCTAAKVPLLVVLVPYGHQVAAHEWTEGRKRQKLAPATVYSAGGMTEVARRLGERGVPVLDLLAPFRAAARADRPLYFALDIHFNAAGNELAAAELTKWLSARPELAEAR